MAQKLKDYYDMAYAKELADKIAAVYTPFDTASFLSHLRDTLEDLTFADRQDLLAAALKESIPLSYPDTLAIFYKLLGPELEGSLGMFSEGWWLWPIGRYVERYGADHFAETTAFNKELTKRFTGEFSMRPVIEHFPAESMQLLQAWSKDENKRVRRLASECLRIRLPWAKRLYVVLDYFDEYTAILTNLKDDPDKTIQKSVANNLNDLYKEDPVKFESIIAQWEQGVPSKACQWIIRHASRTKRRG